VLGTSNVLPVRLPDGSERASSKVAFFWRCKERVWVSQCIGGIDVPNGTLGHRRQIKRRLAQERASVVDDWAAEAGSHVGRSSRHRVANDSEHGGLMIQVSITCDARAGKEPVGEQRCSTRRRSRRTHLVHQMCFWGAPTDKVHDDKDVAVTARNAGQITAVTCAASSGANDERLVRARTVGELIQDAVEGAKATVDLDLALRRANLDETGRVGDHAVAQRVTFGTVAEAHDTVTVQAFVQIRQARTGQSVAIS